MKIGRRQLIESVVSQQGECSVEALARKCRVSEMTIRRELKDLSKAGRIIRTHGGAAPAAPVTFHFEFLERAHNHGQAKEEIAVAAAALIPDGASVLMDSGSTTLMLAKQLISRAKLTVVTTSLPIASALQFSAGIRVLLLGGYVRCDSPDLSGALTESNLETVRTDLAFIGADGIDLRGNIYNHSPEVARMLGRMASAAAAVYVVADSSKIGHTALVHFGKIAQWQGLVTDSGLPATQAAALRQAGVNLIIKTKPKRNHHETSK